MMYDDALDLPRDEHGRVVGFAVGREARMRDWLHRKEEREFAKLIVRLRVRKYQRANRPKINAYRREYEARPEVVPGLRAKQRARRARAYRASATVYTCRGCGAKWCKAPWVRNHSAIWCSRLCKLRTQYAARKAVPT